MVKTYLFIEVFLITNGLMSSKVLERQEIIIIKVMAYMAMAHTLRQETFMEQKLWSNRATKMLLI